MRAVKWRMQVRKKGKLTHRLKQTLLWGCRIIEPWTPEKRTQPHQQRHWWHCSERIAPSNPYNRPQTEHMNVKNGKCDDVLTATRLCIRTLTCSSRCCICCSFPERSALLDSGRRSGSHESLHHTISTARGERLTGYEREVKGTVQPEMIV